MITPFAERTKPLENRYLNYLRQVALLIEMEMGQEGVIDNVLWQLKREQIPIIASALKANSDELMTLWLADLIYAVVKDEKLANEAMQVADKKINLKKHKK